MKEEKFDTSDINSQRLLRRKGDRKLIVADIMFGSPHKNCAGVGICKVISRPSENVYAGRNNKCKSAVAMVRIITRRVLVFHFVRRSMCAKTRDKYFRNNIFEVEDPFEFQLPDAEEGENMVIEPGLYAVKRGYHYLSVSFKVRESKEEDRNRERWLLPLFGPHAIITNIG